MALITFINRGARCILITFHLTVQVGELQPAMFTGLCVLPLSKININTCTFCNFDINAYLLSGEGHNTSYNMWTPVPPIKPYILSYWLVNHTHPCFPESLNLLSSNSLD